MDEISYSVLVVTYNRLSKLKKCVECIKAQTFRADQVIIVNNNSNDGTREYLDETGQSDERFQIVHMEENLGGAGGFAKGVEEFVRGNTQWLIMIDDDAMIRPDYAANTADRIRKDGSQEYSAYAGTVYENGRIALNHRRVLAGRIINREQPVDADQYTRDSFPCDQATFCGLVINRRIVEKIGLPRDDFFIWNDDAEYCMRIKTVGNITVVPASIIDHECDNPEGVNNIAVFGRFKEKEYYGVRNRIIVARHYYTRLTTWWIVLFIWLRILKQRLWTIKTILTGNNTEDREAAGYNIQLLTRAYRDGLKEKTGRYAK